MPIGSFSWADLEDGHVVGEGGRKTFTYEDNSMIASESISLLGYGEPFYLLDVWSRGVDHDN